MKIGIVTQYYKSENYGGNLQAYALCEFLNAHGYHAEQVSVDRRFESPLHMAKQILFGVKQIKTISILSGLRARSKAIGDFNQNAIPHSMAYTNRNIAECVDGYDALITGSDQVWHPFAICNAYLLDFVPSSKMKLSYAASMSVNDLTSEQRERYRKSLRDYTAISVREEQAVKLLQPLTDKEIECTIDPTMLLSKEDWDRVCTERRIHEKYIFCYFLGDNSGHRRVVEEYAKQRGLTIVTLPHLLGKFRECDKTFGDYKLYDISPSDFISLIKFAEIVFTDSFHASVFSILYEKEFYVFERGYQKSMGSRLYTLTSLFDITEHFCDSEDKISMEYICNTQPICYDKEFSKFIKLKEKSKNFLVRNLSESR